MITLRQSPGGFGWDAIQQFRPNRTRFLIASFVAELLVGIAGWNVLRPPATPGKQAKSHVLPGCLIGIDSCQWKRC
jgi:hypothetical protein